jgi:hypothetical protein
MNLSTNPLHPISGGLSLRKKALIAIGLRAVPWTGTSAKSVASQVPVNPSKQVHEW